MVLENELKKSLETGFINKEFHSKGEYLPELLVNRKKDGTKVLSSLIKELNSCEEFIFSVAFLTKSGVATLMNTFIELEKKEVQGKILVSQYQNFTEPEALRTILRFKNIELKIAVNNKFHAKGYLFKKKEHYNLIIGSSNLTAGAITSNKEWNLKVSALENSQLVNHVLKECETEFEAAIPVDQSFIESYEEIYRKQQILIKNNKIDFDERIELKPNRMQAEALKNLESLRNEAKKKALLISATGTGKTYLSAFDVEKINPKKFLFLVHRKNIAIKAMNSYKKIFKDKKTYGLFSGQNKEKNADFIFATIQTVSKDDNLKLFNKNEFDYIVIDETHRAGAKTYQKILDYFDPDFLLGMTATPERTDDFDIFNQFNYNIAYEIRLHRALEEDMLSPFHYYGVTDLYVEDELTDHKNFKRLTSKARVKHILDKINLYGTDTGIIKGLIFCSSNKESEELSKKFNQKGYKTIALSGKSSEKERERAIEKLESNNEEDGLDYIFSVDIFNEGIDIPKVNQIIMLRPTQSSIVFIQQLGRGLRKADNKEYLTVIDFIGNYNNNYLIPVALYGDQSYNKDTIRKLIAGGSNKIPGESTINFDKISKEMIFKSIDQANMKLKVDLVNDYKLLKFKLGKIPKMMDFFEHSTREAYLYSEYSKSYFKFVSSIEDELKNKLTSEQIRLLGLFSMEIANSKRVYEAILMLNLIHDKRISKEEFKLIIQEKYKISLDEKTLESIINNLNFGFVTERHDRKRVSVQKKYDINIVDAIDNVYILDKHFIEDLENNIFESFLLDLINYSIKYYDKDFERDNFVKGFSLYKKYSRKDVLRILNWSKNPVAINVGGYKVSSDGSNCPIFITYHKSEDIADTTKYEDEFLDRYQIQWYSKNKRTLDSPDVVAIKNYKEGLRLPLFIKKSDDEDKEFYYMGDVQPIENSFKEETITDNNGNEVPVVKIVLELKHPVKEDLYDYLTKEVQ